MKVLFDVLFRLTLCGFRDLARKETILGRNLHGEVPRIFTRQILGEKRQPVIVDFSDQRLIEWVIRKYAKTRLAQRLTKVTRRTIGSIVNGVETRQPNTP